MSRRRRSGRPEGLGQPAQRHHPRQEQELRDPGHPVAGRARRRHLSRRRPQPGRGHRRLLRRRRELDCRPARPTWTFPHSVDPTLPVLQLQVAVPKYPWTDLAYALAPNGHGGGPSGQDIYSPRRLRPQPDRRRHPGHGNPLGVAKTSYIAGLYAEGTTRRHLRAGHRRHATNPDRPETNEPRDIPAWHGRISGTGEPYSTATRRASSPGRARPDRCCARPTTRTRQWQRRSRPAARWRCSPSRAGPTTCSRPSSPSGCSST